LEPIPFPSGNTLDASCAQVFHPWERLLIYGLTLRRIVLPHGASEQPPEYGGGAFAAPMKEALQVQGLIKNGCGSVNGLTFRLWYIPMIIAVEFVPAP